MAGLADGAPPDSAPSQLARALAFAAILFAGLCGGLIGYAVVDIGCDGDCDTAAGLVGLGGAAVASAGVGVVAFLTLRAMAEWRQSQPRREAATAVSWPDREAAPLSAARGSARESGVILDDTSDSADGS